MAREDRDRRKLRIAQLDGFRARIGQAFDQEWRLERLRELHAGLETILSGQGDDAGRHQADRLVAEFQSLKEGKAAKAAHQSELLIVQDLPPSARPRTLTQAWQPRKATGLRPSVRKQALNSAGQLSLF